MRFLTVLVLLLVPALAVAGPNAGGVLVVHANTSLVYTSDTTSYCGQSGLAACSLAVTSVPWDPETTTVFYVIAAFPDTSQPRLKAITWGVDWDDSKLVILAHGSCADFDVPDGGWPASGKGIGQSFLETQTGLLRELYWFAGYAYGAESDTTSFRLIPHPVQGGTMADDGMPPTIDDMNGYGLLGFGRVGWSPCQGPDSPGPGGESPDTPVYDPVVCTARVLDGWSGRVFSDVTVKFREDYVVSHCRYSACTDCTPEFATRTRSVKTNGSGIATCTFSYDQCDQCEGSMYCRENPGVIDDFSAWVEFSPSESALAHYVVYRVQKTGISTFTIYLMPDSEVAARFAPVLHSHSYENQTALADADASGRDHGTLEVNRLQQVYSGDLDEWHKYSASGAWCTYGQPKDYAHVWMQLDFASDIPPGAQIGERPLYFHVFQLSEDHLVVQYYMFYNENDLGELDPTGTFSHEGDWEYVAVKIQNINGTLVPQKVNMGRHECRRTLSVDDCWWGSDRAGSYYDVAQGWNADRNHLHVWVAARSHACYNRFEPVFTVEVAATPRFWDRVDYNIADEADGTHLYLRYDRLVNLGEVWDESDVTMHGLQWDYHRTGTACEFMPYIGQFGGDPTSPGSPYGDALPREWSTFHENNVGNECAEPPLGEIHWRDAPYLMGNYLGEFWMCVDGSAEKMRFEVPAHRVGDGFAIMVPLGPNTLVFPPGGDIVGLGEWENGSYLCEVSRIGGEGRVEMYMYGTSPPWAAIAQQFVFDVKNGCGGLAGADGPARDVRPWGLEINPVPAADRCGIRVTDGGPLDALEVFGVDGTVVAVIAGMNSEKGWTYEWNLEDAGGRRVAPGVYFVRASGRDGRVAHGRVIVVD